MPRPRKLSPEILEAALHGLEAQRIRVDSQIAEVRQLLGGGPQPPATPPPETPRPRRKRRLSAAGRKAIIEATKKRWAEFHKKAAK